MSCSQSRLQEVAEQHGSNCTQGGSQRASLRRMLAELKTSALGPVIGRTVTVGIAMLGLAAIGTVSLTEGGRVGEATASAAQAAASVLSLPPLPKGTAQPSHLAGVAAGAAPAPSASPSATAPEQAPPSAEAGVTAEGKIVLNTANAAQLDRLPGVGPKRAEQILALRVRLGRFRSLNDLLRIRGIGRRTLQKMLPHLVLDPPAPPPAATAQAAAP